MKRPISFVFFAVLFCALSLCLAACGGFNGGGNSTPKSDRFQASYGLEKTKPDPIASRRIVFLETHSGEKLDTVYYHEGHYDVRELRKINYLFRDRHANVVGEIDPELIDYLVDIRTRFNLPSSVTFEVLNGYRTPATNAMMSRTNKNVAIESLHIHGWAVDFRIPGVDGRAICEIAKTMQRGGVAYYPKSNHIHVDLGNIRTWHEK
jgi:uncharacterized protein YcbK (DUF882 family)